MVKDSPQDTTPESETAERLSRSKSIRRRVSWLIAGIVLLSGGILLSQRPSGSTGGGRGQRGRGGGGAIPVSVATVTQGNMGDYINALGTVTSVYTVTVTSRVAGALVVCPALKSARSVSRRVPLYRHDRQVATQNRTKARPGSIT